MTTEELIKALRIKSDMIHMGERIAWGSECILMDEAADRLEALDYFIRFEVVGDQTGDWDFIRFRAQKLLAKHTTPPQDNKEEPNEQ